MKSVVEARSTTSQVNIISVGLLSMLSDDQGPFVLEFCAAAALSWIFALEEGVTVPARFGFVCGCLKLAAACVIMVRASTCSMDFFSSLQVWISGFSFVCEEFDLGRRCSRMEQS